MAKFILVIIKFVRMLSVYCLVIEHSSTNHLKSAFCTIQISNRVRERYAYLSSAIENICIDLRKFTVHKISASLLLLSLLLFSVVHLGTYLQVKTV